MATRTHLLSSSLHPFKSRGWRGLALVGVIAGIACSSSAEKDSSGSNGGGRDGGSSPGDGSPSTGNGGASNTNGSGGSSPTASGGLGSIPDGSVIAEQLCGDEGCACSNGIDDDNDGKVDGFDEECTGPLDNDEGSFATGIPGDNRDPKWQDCFFDGNSGAGDDGCRYHTECLTGERDSDDASCAVADQCRDYCSARTPNGCDCFGCCTVQTGSGSVDIFIGDSCSLENIDDEEACTPCTKTTACGNDCGECELCLGRTVEDLPDHCGAPPPPDGGVAEGGTPQADGATPPPPPPAYTCDGGRQVCAASSDCPANYYCALGCCLVFIQ